MVFPANRRDSVSATAVPLIGGLEAVIHLVLRREPAVGLQRCHQR